MNAMKELCAYFFIARTTNKLPTTGISQLDAGSSIVFSGAIYLYANCQSDIEGNEKHFPQKLCSLE